MLKRSMFLGVLVAAAVVLCTAAPASAQDARVSARAVSFEVDNVNRSKLACATDGQRYTIRGHIVGTRAQLRDASAVTLYLHGIGFGEFFWRSKVARGYDFAAGMARRGHVSVVIDRLGYGRSDKPAGFGSCFGGHADMAHQIALQLRSGDYGGATSPSFDRVALVGHSAGGLTSEVAAFSFGDIDAIGVLAYADQPLTPSVQRARPTSRPRSAPREASRRCSPPAPADTRCSVRRSSTPSPAFFYSVRPQVFADVFPLLSRNPCGDLASYVPAPNSTLPNLASITVPVLYVEGTQDALYPPPAGRAQAARYTGSSGVTFRSLPRTGHALTFERGRVALQRHVARWLSDLDG